MNFTVKVSFNGDIRRFNFTAPSSSSSSSHPFNSLLASVVKLYSPKLNNLTGAPVLKYLDDEQELVTLSTDDELREAYDLAAASSSGQKVLKLFVFAPSADQNGNGDNESDEEEASPLAPADAAPASSRVWSVQVEDASPEQEQEFDAAPAVTITSVPSSPAVASSFFATQASAPPPPSSSAPAPAAETKQDVKEDTKEDVKEDPKQHEEDSCGGAGGAFGAAGGSCFGRIMLFVHDFLAQPGAFDALRAVWPSVKAELLQGVPVNDIIERAINGEKSPFSAELKNHPALQIALSKSDRLAHLYSFATARFPFAVPLVIRFVDNFLDGAVDLESLQHSLPFAFLRGAFGGRDAETGAFGGFPRGPCGPCSPAAPAAPAAASASATSACGGRSHCASRSESRCRPHPQCHRAAATAAAASALSSVCHPHAGAAPRFSSALASSSSSSSAPSASVARGGRSTVSAPAPTSASATSESEVVHAHVQCDGCQIYPIVGARYKCTRCHNYDLCESCESTGQHPADHPLLKFRVPFDGEVSVQGGGHHGHHGPHRHHGRHGCHGRPHGAPCGPFGPFGPFRGRCLRRFFAAEDNEAEGGDDYTAQAELAPAQPKPDAPAAAPSSSSFTSGDVDSKNNTVWKAVLEQHKSLPDNSWCRPDTELMKVWSVRNNGSAPWPAGTRVVFVRGDVAPLASTTPVPTAVPGEVVNVSVRVRTPAKEGSFVGQYQVQTGEGLNLLDEPLHVAVKVVDPSVFGAASSVPAATAATAATETPRVAVASQVRAPSSATIVPAPEPSTPAAASVATVSTLAAPAPASVPAPAAPAAAPATPATPALPRDQPQSAEAFPYADQLRELTGMGFTNERLVKYLLINKGGNVLAVLEWLLQHA